MRADYSFVGRDDELEAIGAAFLAATSGSPRIVWIEAPAGMGKTSLVREAVNRLEPGTATVVRGAGDELATDVAFSVVGGWLDDPSPATPFAAAIALLRWVDTFADDRVLVVVIEDMHWADTNSRLALSTMCRRLQHERLLLLLTSRPDGSNVRDDGWQRLRADHLLCREIRLAPLTTADVAALAAAVGVVLTESDAVRLRSHTTGNALHLSTLLHDIPHDQLTSPLGVLPVPPSLRSMTVASLAGLSRPAIDLATSLAVLNRPSSLATLAAVGDLDDPTTALEALLTTDLVEWCSDEPLGVVSFTHPLHRSAIYDDLAPGRRRALHLTAAQVTSRTEALAHRVAAADRSDDGLAAELQQLAEDGASVSPEAAAKLLLWAAELSSERMSREGRLLQAVWKFLQASDITSAAELRWRVEACADQPRRSLVLGALSWYSGGAETAERWLGAAAGQLDDPEVAALALELLMAQYATRSRGADAIDASVRVLALLEPDSDREHRAWAARAIGVGLIHGGPAGLRLLATRFPDNAAVGGVDASLLMARGMLALYAGRATEAEDALSAAVRADSGQRWVTRVYAYLAQALYVSGDWDRSLVCAHLALDLVLPERSMWEATQAHHAAVLVLAGRGDWDGAARHQAAAAEAIAAAPTVEATFSLRLIEAAIARAHGDAAAAMRAVEPLLTVGGPEPTMLSTLGWWAGLVGALLDVDRVADAAQQLDALDRATAVRELDLTCRTTALRARVSACEGRTDDAIAGFTTAVAGFTGDVPLLDRAAIRVDFARLLRATGRRQPAAEQLRLARELLDGVGARPYVERVDDELGAAGFSSTRRRRSPLDLTDRERDVATLVARGMTNKEVAAALYVSRKAVEYHLSNIFGKLGLDSRRQLRDLITTS